MSDKITDRAWGADIPPYLKAKLRSRQELSSGLIDGKDPSVALQDTESLPKREGQSIAGYYSNKNNFNNIADLSSRTPWVRMWTGVKLTGAEMVEEEYEEEVTKEEATSMGVDTEEWEGDTGNVTKKRKVVKVTDGEKMIKELAREVYIIGTNNLSEVDSYHGPHQELEVNENYNKNKQYSQAFLDQNASKKAQYDVFPHEHGVPGDHNKFMKPDAGITSMSSETEGEYGEIRKTTVNFKVHNFHDFDAIYNNYFLRPGAYIFVDYGWDCLEEPLYDPLVWVNDHVNEDFDVKLYGDGQFGTNPDGWVTKNGGDADTVKGFVTDYNAKINMDGSVDCSLTITGENSVLAAQASNSQAQADEKKQEAIWKKFERDLDTELIFEQLYGFMSTTTQKEWRRYAVEAERVEEKLEAYEALLQSAARSAFGAGDDITWMPNHAASLSGIFIKGEQTYISWGLFEDKFLNGYFAHGSSLDLINSKTDDSMKISFDSSNSFACLDCTKFKGVAASIVYERQFDPNLSKGDSDAPTFLIPEQWDYSYNTIKDKSGLTRAQREREVKELKGTGVGEANLKDIKERSKGLMGEDFIDNPMNSKWTGTKYVRINHYTQANDNWDSLKITLADADKYRIPLREVFINTKIIKDAFADNYKKQEVGIVSNIVNSILNTLNTTYDGLWNWIIRGTSANNLSIEDAFYNPMAIAEQDSDKVSAVDQKFWESSKYGDMFVFNIMGPDSIVHNYEVELAMPDDDYGNMIAVKAMTGTDSSFFPPSELIKNSVAFQNLLAEIHRNVSNADLFFENIPELGLYAAKNIAEEEYKTQTAANDYVDMFDEVSTKYDSSAAKASYAGNTWVADTKIQNLLKADEKIISKDDKEIKKKEEETVVESPDIDQDQLNKETTLQTKTTLSEDKLYNNNSDYWKAIIEGTQLLDPANIKAIPLPMTLNLSAYGFGIMQVGDVFDVDFLPQIYLKRVYFQVMKIIHTIEAGGMWSTTLESQFRIKPEKYEDQSAADQQQSLRTHRDFLMLASGIPDDSPLWDQLKGFDFRRASALNNKNSVLDHIESERVRKIEEQNALDDLAKEKEDIELGKKSFNPRNNEFLSKKTYWDSDALRYDSDNFGTSQWHYSAYAYSVHNHKHGNHWAMTSTRAYSYIDDGWTDCDREDQYISNWRYTIRVIAHLADIFDSWSKDWKYYRPGSPSEDPSTFFSNISHMFTFKLTNTTSHIWIGNPIYAYKKSGNWYYDGYGCAGSGGGKGHNGYFSHARQFITDSVIKGGSSNHGKMIFCKKATKCWGFLPSYFSDSTIKSKMDSDYVGFSNSGWNSYRKTSF